MYNLFSLILGLAAWVFAILAFVKSKPNFTATSYAFCAGALLFQLLEVRRRVALCDWSALADTMDFVAIAANVLVEVTILFHALASVRWREKK